MLMAPVSYVRDVRKPPAEWDKRGEELFSAVYRDTAPSVQGLLDAAYPDLGLSYPLGPLFRC